MTMANPKVKVFLTKTEVMTLAGILGGMYGDTFANLYETLVKHLSKDDEVVADEISKLMAQLIELNEDNLLYTALTNINGHISHD